MTISPPGSPARSERHGGGEQTIKTTAMLGIILAIVGGFLAALLDAVRK